MRYHADITAGSLKVRESRIIAGLLIDGINSEAWDRALIDDNVLQTKSPATAKRLGQLLKLRLQTVDAELWQLVRDGSLIVATHACLAASIKHSALLGDFLDLVMREQGSKTRQKLETAAASVGSNLKPLIEAEGREGVREVVASGAGIGFVSTAEFGTDERLFKIPLPEPCPVMSESLICLRDRQEQELIKAFMKLANELNGQS